MTNLAWVRTGLGGLTALRAGTRLNEVLRGALLVVLVVVLVRSLVEIVLIPPRFAVDLEISLRGAERWIAGGEPYLATAFLSPPGATQPFLYPPYVLPFFAGLATIPREVIGPAWILLMLAAATWTVRRFGIPWIWVPLVLAWPPFAEGIVAANLQILLFGAFVALFWRAPSRSWAPEPRDLQAETEHGGRLGALAALVGAIKVSQPHPWLYLLVRRPRAAIAGAAIVVAVVALSIAATGIPIWFDWTDQLGRARDPSWELQGLALARFLPDPVALAIVAGCVVAIPFVPRRFAGEAIGILSVLGTLSLHTFGLLFLVPAMLVIRREFALVAALFIATYSYVGQWAGILVCVAAFAAAVRWPALRERPLGPAIGEGASGESGMIAER